MARTCGVFLAELRERRLTKKGREEQKPAIGTIKSTLSVLRRMPQPGRRGRTPARDPPARLEKLLRAREEIRKQVDPLTAEEAG